MISLIVAHDKNNAIGHRNWMPWNLPEDLKHFRSTTLHSKIVMGRTTFDAMKKPLANRKTYVVTRNQNYIYEHVDVEVVHDLVPLLHEFKNKEETLFICGGADIYRQALPFVDEMWISLVEGEHEADTYFPTYEPSAFDLQSSEEKEGFHILHYRRKRL